VCMGARSALGAVPDRRRPARGGAGPRPAAGSGSDTPPMTAGLPPDRDRTDIEALVPDRYLASVLAAAERGADDAPADTELDPETRRAVGVLRRALVRVHPSFRFEERLASRLAALAAARAEAAGCGVPSPAARSVRPGAPDPLLPAILAGAIDPADDQVL